MPKKTVRLAVLVSGGGSNLQAILDAQKAGQLPGVRIALVLSSKADAYALERARKAGVTTTVVERKTYATEVMAQAAVLEKLIDARADVISLAGYMRKLSPELVRHYRGRIINIHPALLPKFGGPGMYGTNVHEAVLASGDTESGCTVHVVDEEYDHGPVLAQAKVPVLPNDTVDILAARVLELEHKVYPKVLREFCERL